MAPYDSPGKRQFIELLFALAKHSDCQRYATFWGFGADSRRGVQLGFDVIACEVTEAKHGAGRADAWRFGYRFHAGRGSALKEQVDVFHADFDGNASPGNFRELRAIAERTDRWLAVTLAGDHQINPGMQGEAASYTIPAWLTGASGFTLEYLGRYQRNRLGQTMWTAILRRGEGKGEWHPVQPLQIAYSIGDRGYWASRRLYETALLPHRFAPRNEREKAGDRLRYLAKRKRLSSAECRICGTVFVRRGGPQRYCSDACRVPERQRQQQEASQRFYRKVAAVSGTAAEAVSIEEAA